MSAETREQCLLVRIGRQLCALPLTHVEETMRPQPVRPVPAMPPFVLGVAVLRGVAVPVMAAAVLLGEEASSLGETRFVAIKAAGRRVALAVDQVLGVREIDEDELSDLPPLLAAASEQIVSSIGTLDNELLLVLRTVRFVPEDVWREMDAGNIR